MGSEREARRPKGGGRGLLGNRVGLWVLGPGHYGEQRGRWAQGEGGGARGMEWEKQVSGVAKVGSSTDAISLPLAQLLSATHCALVNVPFRGHCAVCGQPVGVRPLW